jgi:hypothetical protein
MTLDRQDLVTTDRQRWLAMAEWQNKSSFAFMPWSA